MLFADPDALEGETTQKRWVPLHVALQLLWEQNPKLHDMGLAVASIEKHGFRDNSAFDMNLTNASGAKGAIVYGNGRIQALAWMYEQKRPLPRGVMRHKVEGYWCVPVEFGLDAVNEAAATAFAIDHNSLTLSGGDFQNYEAIRIYDEALLKDLMQGVYDAGETLAMLDGNDLDELLVEMPAQVDDYDELLDLQPHDVPDAIFPSDNPYDIPTLLLDWQADYCDMPVETWGAKKRDKMNGTWVFYTDDNRFNSLWAAPETVVNTRCVNAVEPNFTTTPQTPYAIGLYEIYRKRWIARYWQSHGIRIFVDMNVASRFYEANLLGVPKGWKAYATRGYTRSLDDLQTEVDLARAHAGTHDILFLVYGGGDKVREYAQSNGLIHIPEAMLFTKWSGGGLGKDNGKQQDV